MGHMQHPHEYLLQEFKISIDKLVPLTPPEIKAEAEKLYEELAANPAATEQQIEQALIQVGKKEYPYRKAYEELCSSDEEQRLQKEVFQRLEPAVVNKVKAVTNNGVHVIDYVNSRLFEQDLSPTERYQVEQAILLAHDVLSKQCDERAQERQTNYLELVEKWKKEQERLQGLIDRLRQLGQRDATYTQEINDKAKQLEEGWSIVERDPNEEEIVKEIEYWNTVLEQAEDPQTA